MHNHKECTVSPLTSVGLPALIRRLPGLALAVLLASVVVACGGGGATADPALTAPSISTQPNDQNVVEGAAATFAVVGAGSSPLSYQWSSSTDGVSFTAIPGATSATHVVVATTLAQSGTRFRVVVSNGAGATTSGAALLTVTANLVAPGIAVQPADQTVTAPATATFNVTATGSSPTYEWQLSTDAGTTYVPVAGAASLSSLVISNSTTGLSGQLYRVRVSNAAGSVTSAGALLTVDPTPVAPAFTTQPVAQTIVTGQAASFTASASGSPAPAIRWRLNGANLSDGLSGSGVCAGATVGGANTTTLSLTQVPLTCNGAIFGAIAANGVAPDASSVGVALTVNPVPAPPVITTQPAHQAVLTDATATFAVAASGAGLIYQWKKNGTTIVGATAATYTTPAVTWVDSGAQYTVVVTNNDGSATSSAAQLSLSLSANQQAFEGQILAPGSGSHRITWNLNYSGPQTSGVNYAGSDFAVLGLSPLTNGPQTIAQSLLANMTSTLALMSGATQRVLKDGAILVVPPTQSSSRVSYVGSDVRIDYLASDNTTIAWSQIRTDFTTVPLTGLMAGSTDDFAHFHNSFFSNPQILRSTSAYLPGASYLKYTAHVMGDRYAAFDCAAATTGVNITPCQTGTTLTTALTAGITSSSDATTYTLADGVVTAVGGLPVWVATAPRPVSAVLSTVPQYRIYFQMNGNVYTGSLLKNGSVYATSYYVSNPAGATATDRLTFLPFQIRMNKAARDSVAAAMAM